MNNSNQPQYQIPRDSKKPQNNTSANKTPKLKQPDPKFFQNVKENFASVAEQVMRKLCQEKIKLSASQLRNIFSLINDINFKIHQKGELDLEIQNDIKYLQVRIYYACGKDSVPKGKDRGPVTIFVDESRIIELLLCVDSVEKWAIFSKYAEALVAFHKYYFGGKE